MNYCVAYYPTSGCLETCNCEQTELGQVLYTLPSRKKVLTLATAPSLDQPQIIAPLTLPVPPAGTATPSTPGTATDSTADLTQCIATCNEKCKSEIAEKKDACVNLCVNQCKASYDFQIKQQQKEKEEQQAALNKTLNNSTSGNITNSTTTGDNTNTTTNQTINSNQTSIPTNLTDQNPVIIPNQTVPSLNVSEPKTDPNSQTTPLVDTNQNPSNNGTNVIQPVEIIP